MRPRAASFIESSAGVLFLAREKHIGFTSVPALGESAFCSKLAHG